MLTVAPNPDFDALVSLTDADAYWQRMGGIEWAAKLVDERESAIRRGTQYVLARSIKPAHLDPVDARVAAATCEAAMLHLSGELYGVIPASAITSERVGSLAVSYAAPQNGGKARFPVIDDLLRGLSSGSLARIAVERA